MTTSCRPQVNVGSIHGQTFNIIPPIASPTMFGGKWDGFCVDELHQNNNNNNSQPHHHQKQGSSTSLASMSVISRTWSVIRANIINPNGRREMSIHCLTTNHDDDGDDKMAIDDQTKSSSLAIIHNNPLNNNNDQMIPLTFDCHTRLEPEVPFDQSVSSFIEWFHFHIKRIEYCRKHIVRMGTTMSMMPSTQHPATVWIGLALFLCLFGIVLGLPQTSPTSYQYQQHQIQHHHHQPKEYHRRQQNVALTSSSSSSSSSSTHSSSPYPTSHGSINSQSSSSSSYQPHYHHPLHPFKQNNNQVQHQQYQKYHHLNRTTHSSQSQLDSNHSFHQPTNSIGTTTNATCLNCKLRLNRTEAEYLKLEAIKQQILSKLNMARPPRITNDQLKREQAIEAIRKAKLNARVMQRMGGKRYRTNNINGKRKRHSRRESDIPIHRRLVHHSSMNQSEYDLVGTEIFGNYNSNNNNNNEEGEEDEDDGEDEEEEESFNNDEYYGKTSEIIAFAEPGRKINGHTLVDLIPPHDNLHRLAVSKAILWVRLTYNRSTLKRLKSQMMKPNINRPITLYIFKMDKQSSTHKNNRTESDEPPPPPLIYPTPFFQMMRTNNTNIDQNGSNETERLSPKLLTTHHLVRADRGWHQIEVTNAIRDWFQRSTNAKKLSLLIDCVGCNNLLDIDLVTNDPTKVRDRNGSSSPKTNRHGNLVAHHRGRGGGRRQRRHFQPFVVITTKTILKRRTRRHAYNCEDGVKQCCKQSLYIDFAELGWDEWIIFPRGYTANYCTGECVQLHRTPDVMAYFHSHVLEEFRLKNPYASVSPCCAPTKLSSISLIYFDPDGHIIKSDLPKMVVDECGCT